MERRRQRKKAAEQLQQQDQEPEMMALSPAANAMATSPATNSRDQQDLLDDGVIVLQSSSFV